MRTIAMLMMLATPFGMVCAQDPLADKVYFGFGVGIDHGGLGVRIDVRPLEHFGVFGGVGWALGGLGWNAGLHIPILTGHEISPYLTGMYGYNTMYVAKNRVTGTQWDRDIYYGPSFGGGLEFSVREGSRLIQVGVLVPVRSDQVLIDHPEIERDLWPVLISLGLRYKM